MMVTTFGNTAPWVNNLWPFGSEWLARNNHELLWVVASLNWARIERARDAAAAVAPGADVPAPGPSPAELTARPLKSATTDPEEGLKAILDSTVTATRELYQAYPWVRPMDDDPRETDPARFVPLTIPDSRFEAMQTAHNILWYDRLALLGETLEQLRWIDYSVRLEPLSRVSSVEEQRLRAAYDIETAPLDYTTVQQAFLDEFTGPWDTGPGFLSIDFLSLRYSRGYNYLGADPTTWYWAIAGLNKPRRKYALEFLLREKLRGTISQSATPWVLRVAVDGTLSFFSSSFAESSTRASWTQPITLTVGEETYTYTLPAGNVFFDEGRWWSVSELRVDVDLEIPVEGRLSIDIAADFPEAPAVEFGDADLSVAIDADLNITIALPEHIDARSIVDLGALQYDVPDPV